MPVRIDFLNVSLGDKEVFIQDTTREERGKLYETVSDLMKNGFALFLIQGEESYQIRGYDADSHEWILLSNKKATPKKAGTVKVPAQNTNVTAVGATAGG